MDKNKSIKIRTQALPQCCIFFYLVKREIEVSANELNAIYISNTNIIFLLQKFYSIKIAKITWI